MGLSQERGALVTPNPETWDGESRTPLGWRSPLSCSSVTSATSPARSPLSPAPQCHLGPAGSPPGDGDSRPALGHAGTTLMGQKRLLGDKTPPRRGHLGDGSPGPRRGQEPDPPSGPPPPHCLCRARSSPEPPWLPVPPSCSQFSSPSPWFPAPPAPSCGVGGKGGGPNWGQRSGGSLPSAPSAGGPALPRSCGPPGDEPGCWWPPGHVLAQLQPAVSLPAPPQCSQ